MLCFLSLRADHRLRSPNSKTNPWRWVPGFFQEYPQGLSLTQEFLAPSLKNPFGHLIKFQKPSLFFCFLCSQDCHHLPPSYTSTQRPLCQSPTACTVQGTFSLYPLPTLFYHKPFLPGKSPPPLSRKQSGLRFWPEREGQAQSYAGSHVDCVFSSVSSVHTLASTSF